jgi:hypothetical protein
MTEKVFFMRQRLLALMVSALLSAGCFSPETPKVPVWVEHPPAPTAGELYGVSVADTFNEALVSATGNIASTMLISAEASLEKKVRDETLRKKSVAAMKSVLQTIDYPGVELKQRAEMGEQSAVLVRMPRSAFAEQILLHLKAHKKRIEDLLAAHTDDPAFVRLGLLGRSHEEQPLLLAEITLLETANPSADTKPYRAFSQQIEDDYNALKFGTSLTIISDADAIVYVAPLKKALRSEGIAASGNQVGTILLFGDSQREHSGGLYHVKTRVRFESTVKRKRIAQSERFLEARSANGYDEARRKTAESLVKLIKKEGLFHTFGF